MVNSLNGISAAEYQAYMKVQNQIINGGVSTPNLTYANDSVTFSGNKCTDGKDDGKIGFFGAVGNAIKGVGKTVVNGIKGMFTDKNGKFSLGKTLLSIGTAAACIAFPAVGVAACVVGGTMGAVQVGKGIYNAATAKTDAEAKQAWQDIGGGTFTAAASVVGAKAGIKAVQNTAGGATSALGQLDDAATMGQKLSALGKDMVTSTKNQAGKINKALTPYAQAAEGYKNQAITKLNNTEFAQGVQMLREAIKSGNADDIAAAKALLKEITVGKAQTKFSNSEFGTGLEMLREAIKSGNADEIAAAKALIKEATIGKAQTKFSNSEFGTGIEMLRDAIKSGNADDVAAAEALIKECITSSKVYAKTVQSDVIQALKMLIEAQRTGNIDDAAFAKEYLAFIKDNFIANASEYATSIQQHLGLDSIALEETIQSILQAYQTPEPKTV